MENVRKFSQLLTQGVRQIKSLTGNNLDIIQDEIGYALGREGGSCIQYWRRQGSQLPSDPYDIYSLARELAERGGLQLEECIRFLEAGDYPNPIQAADEIFKAHSQTNGNSPINGVENGQGVDFVTGVPITTPRLFFGRERELRFIYRCWQKRPLQNVAIIGKKRSGKSSLLHCSSKLPISRIDALRKEQQKSWLKDAHLYKWVYIDFQDPRLLHPETLFAFILKNLNFPSPSNCQLEQFIDIMARRLLSPTIIMMDEIGAALEAPDLDRRFWDSLRSLVNTYSNGNLGFLITGLASPYQLASDNDITSPFFNLFRTLKLGPFSESEAIELINHSKNRIPADVSHWILETSHLWPALLQILCDRYQSQIESGFLDEDWQEEVMLDINRFDYLWNSD